jgi:hypothetical protein
LTISEKCSRMVQYSITAELTKESSRCLWKNIYQLIATIGEKEIIPEEWKTAIICPIFRKGSKLEFEIYRGISSLNVMYKIFLIYWHSTHSTNRDSWQVSRWI